MQRHLRREAKSPSRAESSREANFGFRPMENRRILSSSNCKLVDASSVESG
ncbi:hypothetical protein RchiOBHm_Chr7g0203791 [Rosa chinensis]|uniref:Uncharacterized protein n=1 Tax=Rosa chinensis TaxID=74649 RepID=A0A2P6P8I2_ROSCH|nr:hypothetical protein RchiOBHm_Chr7g0203791 [Rosa chinensis]